MKTRIGKTAKDHKNNCAARNAENKARRAAWQNDKNDKVFPYMTCNGRKNRHRFMGKNASYIVR